MSKIGLLHGEGLMYSVRKKKGIGIYNRVILTLSRIRSWWLCIPALGLKLVRWEWQILQSAPLLYLLSLNISCFLNNNFLHVTHFVSVKYFLTKIGFILSRYTKLPLLNGALSQDTYALLLKANKCFKLYNKVSSFIMSEKKTNLANEIVYIMFSGRRRSVVSLKGMYTFSITFIICYNIFFFVFLFQILLAIYF